MEIPFHISAALHPAADWNFLLLNDTYLFYCFYFREFIPQPYPKPPAAKNNSQKSLKNRMNPDIHCSVRDFLKKPGFRLRDKTQGAYPVIRDILILRTRSNSVFRVADLLVVYPAAIDTIPFYHIFIFLRDCILTCCSRHPGNSRKLTKTKKKKRKRGFGRRGLEEGS